MLKTTIGQLAVNQALPPEMRDYHRTVDAKTLTKMLQEVSQNHPDKYTKIAKDLSDVGKQVGYHSGGYSFGLKHLLPTHSANLHKARLGQQVQNIYMQPGTDDEKEKNVISLLQTSQAPLNEANYEESLREGNPLAMQVLSGARGNKSNLSSLRGADLLYEDHRDRLIPIPILKSYSQGLTPAQYYASAFGARKGVIDVKEGVRRAGFFGKQLIQAAHRLVVIPGDREEDPDHPRGLPVPTDDPDSEGSLLAHPVGGHARNTILTPHILASLRQKGIEHILVRSPAVGGHESGGLYARDVGVRESGALPHAGTFVGIPAAQALSEPVSQGGLSSKHHGGVAGAAKAVSGFAQLNQLVQVPKSFQGATHAQKDGKVTSVRPAPQGGHYITVEGRDHYAAQGLAPSVKKGDVVEAGDLLSEGSPNPAQIVQHKHVGEGRRAFTSALRQAFRDAGLPGHRRNIEVLARGLIDHVRLTDEMGPWAPEDVVPYTRLEAHWEPRAEAILHPPRRALGMYLEKPVLHHTIGTKVRPSVIKDLEQFGIKHVLVHPEPPPFEPVMIRGLENLGQDPDWLTRFLGSYLEKGLLRGAHRGDVSDETGTSYVPALARTVHFGLQGLTAPGV